MTAKPWIALFCFTLAGIVRQFGCRIESHKRFYSSLQRWQSRHRRRVVNVQNQPWNLWSLRQKCDCLCHRRWMTPRWAESGLCGEKSMCARVCPCVCVCVLMCACLCVSGTTVNHITSPSSGCYIYIRGRRGVSYLSRNPHRIVIRTGNHLQSPQKR